MNYLRIWPPLFGFASLLVPVFVLAADSKPEPRGVVGKSTSATAMLVQREAGKPWQVVKQGADLFSADLLVGKPGAALDSKNGAARLKLLSDLEGNSPYPVLEAAVVLHGSESADLDFTLERGRVEIENKKAKGAAKVKVRFRDQAWELTLKEAGTKAALETYGRWPRGVFFSKKENAQEAPTSIVVLLVLKGEIDLKYGDRQMSMSAPPGPALFQWDSVDGPDATGAKRMEKLPAWALPADKPAPEAQSMQAALDRLVQREAAKGSEPAIAEGLASKNPVEQRLSVVYLGALDDLPRLIDALGDPRANVRDAAVLTLRHWIGRGPGQDLRLYTVLTKDKKYSVVHADIVMELLHSLGDQQLGRPETYEALIAYLKHDKLAIRELAKWQLYRLVPAVAKEIPYDPADSKKEQEAAYEEWKKRIPEGKLPPKAEK